jgi:hypothetical protein
MAERDLVQRTAVKTRSPCRSPVLAHRVVPVLYSNLAAFEGKRTLSSL